MISGNVATRQPKRGGCRRSRAQRWTPGTVPESRSREVTFRAHGRRGFRNHGRPDPEADRQCRAGTRGRQRRLRWEPWESRSDFQGSAGDRGAIVHGSGAFHGDPARPIVGAAQIRPAAPRRRWALRGIVPGACRLRSLSPSLASWRALCASRSRVLWASIGSSNNGIHSSTVRLLAAIVEVRLCRSMMTS